MSLHKFRISHKEPGQPMHHAVMTRDKAKRWLLKSFPDDAKRYPSGPVRAIGVVTLADDINTAMDGSGWEVSAVRLNSKNR